MKTMKFYLLLLVACLGFSQGIYAQIEKKPRNSTDLIVFQRVDSAAIEIKKHTYENGKLHYQINTQYGMFNGKYIAWYKNGQKKAEGNFKNNQRVGIWTAWDSAGQTRMIRNYENSFGFKTVAAKNEKGENISLPEKTSYDLTKNKDGYYKYPKLIEKNIIVSKRIWRTIEPNINNKIIFENNTLFKLILKNIADTQKLKAYDTQSDEFEKELTLADIKSKLTNTTDVVAYKIKEDWFFDSSLQLSESRIIGLCPVIKNKDGNPTDLCWIYYPTLRGILATEKIKINDEPLITTMEDVFQFRYFNSSIYKESNNYNRKISDYKTGKAIKEEAEAIEMAILDLENNTWISLTEINKKPY